MGSALIGESPVREDNIFRDIYNARGKYNDILMALQDGLSILFLYYVYYCVYIFYKI